VGTAVAGSADIVQTLGSDVRQGARPPQGPVLVDLKTLAILRRSARVAAVSTSMIRAVASNRSSRLNRPTCCTTLPAPKLAAA
jgi:hypothetical protein